MSNLGWDLKLSPVFSAATVFSCTLSPIGHCSLTTIINCESFVFVYLPCDRDVAHLMPHYYGLTISRWAFTAQ